jgi:hypothetical protein
MGGLGSGRGSYASTGTVEQARRIDIRYMRKRGLLRPGVNGTLNWNRGGTPTGEISFTASNQSLELRYRVQEHGGDWENINQTIQLALTPCLYGGHRKWLVCPHCTRRVAVLCFASKLFYCRTCCRLAYGSQREDKLGRMARTRDKLAQRIFEDDSYTRKKGMHRKTFERLYQQHFDLECEFDYLVAVRLGALEGLLKP